MNHVLPKREQRVKVSVSSPSIRSLPSSYPTAILILSYLWESSRQLVTI